MATVSEDEDCFEVKMSCNWSNSYLKLEIGFDWSVSYLTLKSASLPVKSPS